MSETVDVDEIRNEYSNPSVSKGYHNRKGEYSVGGALLMHTEESSSVHHTFPDYSTVAKTLAELNPELDLGIAKRWALFILKLNDNRNFDMAFDCLEAALQADSAPNRKVWDRG